ncbi:MAG: phosphoglycolate phosphatase [Arenicella sp.]|jgi:phosphoglycolate phosphatase
MQLRAVLLDLDGTLVDTAPDMVGSLNRVLQSYNMRAADVVAAAKQVSNGGRALIEFGFGEAIGQGDIPQVEQLVEEFLADYKQHVANHSFVYEGMLEVLEYCESNSLKWGVITNKPLDLAKDLLEGLGLLDRCAILLGGDSLPVKKPDPVPMLHTCMVLSLAPSECLYVGDHLRDIQAGNAAGMDTASALWGYIDDAEKPDEWNANFILNSPKGLLNLVKEKHPVA